MRLVLHVTTCSSNQMCPLCSDSTTSSLTLPFKSQLVLTYQMRTNIIFQFRKLWAKINIVALELEKYAENTVGKTFFFRIFVLISRVRFPLGPLGFFIALILADARWSWGD